MTEVPWMNLSVLRMLPMWPCAMWNDSKTSRPSGVIRPVSVLSITVTTRNHSHRVNLQQHRYWHDNRHDHFTALFPGPPGWAGARRELLDFVVQGKINRGRHTDHPAGRHSIRTNQCPPPPSPIFFMGRMPFLPPNQQCQSTEGNCEFGLGRRCYSSPQRCYLHHLRTLVLILTIPRNFLIVELPVQQLSHAGISDWFTTPTNFCIQYDTKDITCTENLTDQQHHCPCRM